MADTMQLSKGEIVAASLQKMQTELRAEKDASARVRRRNMPNSVRVRSRFRTLGPDHGTS